MSTSPPDDPLARLPAPPPEAPLVVEPLPTQPAQSPVGSGSLVGQDVITALAADPEPPPYRRRIRRPLILFVLTCVTTFFAGCYHWMPLILGQDVDFYFQKSSVERSWIHAIGSYAINAVPNVFDAARHNWRDGLVFMSGVMCVLLMHEMGHFLMTVRHRIPASFPYFIPIPIMITGTMGAVISMDGSRANRKELFDIGLAGPLAGLVVTIPLVVIGIMTSKAVHVGPGHHFGDPLLVKLLIPWLRPMPPNFELTVNPIYMAGWVGMLITGLNMLPVSQLDGGHVAYAVLGRGARWLGRLIFVMATLFTAFNIITSGNFTWALMLVIVYLIGVDHPPTADDTARIGPLRWTLGLLSLLIPIFCFPPIPMY
jgi:Zn-dependent protease